MSKISIQIALYNTEKYLGPCLRSIQAEAPADAEILILDDCSTDRSPDIVREYAATDSRIRYEKMPEQSGVAMVRRRLVEMTDAELLVPFDSDDYMLPGHLGRRRELMTVHPELAAVYGKAIIFFWKGEGRTYLRGCPFSPLTLHLSNPIKHGSIMYRREAALAAGNYMKTSTGEGKKEVSLDLFLWERLALTGPVFFDDRFSMLYRLHVKQLSAREDGKYETANRFIDDWIIDRDRDLWDALVRGDRLKLDPQQLPLLMQFMGIWAYRAGKGTPQYAKILEAAAGINPDDGMIRLYLCEAYLLLQQYAEAVATARELPDRHRNSAYIGTYASEYLIRALQLSGASEAEVETARRLNQACSERYSGTRLSVEQTIADTIMKYGGEES